MYLWCVIFSLTLCFANSARILGIFHMPAYSHFQLGDRIFKELAARGHEVTVISPYELTTPVKNLKHVVITGFKEELEEVKLNLFKEKDKGIVTQIFEMNQWGTYFSERILSHPNVQNLLNSNDKFDLIIQEAFLNEAFYGFSHHYKAPTIAVSSMGSSCWTNGKMGNPANPSYVPHLFLSYSCNMNFLERAFNTFVYTATEIFDNLRSYPSQNQLLQKYFPGAPHLNDLMYNTSLMLLNSHSSTNCPVPLLPSMIEIGGYHVTPPKPLPKDLQDYLDNAKDGFIFFSLGSNIKSKDMPEDKRNEILKVLGNLKLKVLWKWESDVLPGKPDNVMVRKWLPQQDILAHPNIKLFITHGGLLSTIETIYHGVPILAIPIFGDQELNAATAEAAGYGLTVPYVKLSESSLTAALDQLQNNPKYSKNAKQRSAIMRDQLTKPMDRAIYWIEYVIKHKGAPHLRSAALNLTWYQYLLFDVLAVFILILVSIMWVLKTLVRCLLRANSKSAVNKQKKRN